MSLLSQLLKYQPINDADRQHKSEFLAFLEKNPNCFDRKNFPGHVTGSAWLVDPERKKVLLTYHKKIGKWLQLGGHADGETDILNVALREAKEESGLKNIHPLSSNIFDIDIHVIPAYGSDPAHQHYDVRYLLQAGDIQFKVSEESFELSWVDISNVSAVSNEDSLLRMAQKCVEFVARSRRIGLT